MKRHHLIMTTIISAGILMHTPITSVIAKSITDITASTSIKPMNMAEMKDLRLAAGRFVEHINFARVALAMKNPDLAKGHLIQARNMITLIQSATVEKQRVTQLESGRVVYEYDTEYEYHYFPIHTGLMQVKELSSGPVWAVNDLAVTDADIVYLSLDLTDDNAIEYLNNTDLAIASNDFKEADKQLARLTNAVVTVDSKMSMPADKARDNIALARNFLFRNNYDGARFALKHADDALNEMQNSANHKEQRSEIIAMRKDVADMRDRITKKDPTVLQQADKKMSTWWGELKSWSKREY